MHRFAAEHVKHPAEQGERIPVGLMKYEGLHSEQMEQLHVLQLVGQGEHLIVSSSFQNPDGQV